MANRVDTDQTAPQVCTFCLWHFVRSFGVRKFRTFSVLIWFPIYLFQFLYDTSQLPSCMMNEKFQVFGIHIYLQEPTKLLCEPVTLDLIEQRATPRSNIHTGRPPQRTLITSIEDNGPPISGNHEIDVSGYKSSGTTPNTLKKSLIIQIAGVILFVVIVEAFSI